MNAEQAFHIQKILLITCCTGHFFGSSSSAIEGDSSSGDASPGVVLPEGEAEACEGEAEEDHEELKLIESIQASISSIREAAADGEGSEVGGLLWTEGSWGKIVRKDRKLYKTLKKSVLFHLARPLCDGRGDGRGRPADDVGRGPPPPLPADPLLPLGDLLLHRGKLPGDLPGVHPCEGRRRGQRRVRLRRRAGVQRLVKQAADLGHVVV